MSRHIWTTAELDELRERYATTDTYQLAREMGMTHGQVRSQAKNLGLTKGTRHVWSAAEVATLRRRYPHEATRQLAEDLGVTERCVYQKALKLGLRKTEAHLAGPDGGRLQKGQRIGRATEFKPGQTTWNKGRKGWDAGGRSHVTRFQPGQRPHTWVPVGTEVVDTYGYRKRKVRDDAPTGRGYRNWRFVHHLVWEAHNGPIPAGHIVTFRNGDRTDVSIENLQLMSRRDNVRRNGMARFPPALRSAILTSASLSRRIKETEDEEQDRGSAQSPVRDDRAAEG